MVRGREGVTGALRALESSIVPLVCPGCGCEDVPWCEGCAALWWEEPFRADDGAPRLDIDGRRTLPVWALAALLGPAHLMIRAWKDGRRRDLDPFFTEAMSRAAISLAEVLSDAEAVVPIPPHSGSNRARGVDLTAMLARAAVLGFRSAGRCVSVTHPFRVKGGESRSMSARERVLNAKRGIQMVPHRMRFNVVVLVDDVMTTGASLARASSLLERQGVVVIGALTLAATPPRIGTSVP